MKSYAELKLINKIATQRELVGNTLNTPLHGLTGVTGAMNTHNPLQGTQKTNLSTREQKKPLALGECVESERKLSALLLICFDVLDTFGKEPEQLANINKAFQMFLADYPYSSIEKAFKVYMSEQSVMPKPADIIKIIETGLLKNKRLSSGLTEGQHKALLLQRERTNLNKLF